MRRLWGLLALLLTAPVSAQAWQERGTDAGWLIYGQASVAGNRLGPACTAPLPKTRPLMKIGQRQIKRAAPCATKLSLGADLANPFHTSPSLPKAGIALGDLRSLLPAMGWDDLFDDGAVYLALGTAPQVVPLGNGRDRIQNSSSVSVCAGGILDRVWCGNGARVIQ